MVETDRSKIIDIITGGATPVSFDPIDPAAFQTGITHTTRTTPNIGGTAITRFAKPKSDSTGGFLGGFGKLIDFIDWPAAGIRSGIKELRDDEFSWSDWWKQGGGGPFADDRMMMAEVMRETGSPLAEEGSLKEMGAGLGLDIATDPLTYFFGVGAIPRILKSAGMVPDIVKALSRAAGRSSSVKKSAELLAAADKVKATNSIGAAGKALEEIGLPTGLGFMLPGTGRLGRHIVEKPLNILSGGLVSKAANLARAKQVPAFATGNDFFDVAKYAPEIASSMRLLKKGDDAVSKALSKSGVPELLHAEIKQAAAIGQKAAVEIPWRIPWSTPLVAAVAPLPGTAMRLATQTKVIGAISNALNYRAPITALRRLGGKDPDASLAAIYLEEAANMAHIEGATLRRKLLGVPGSRPFGYRGGLYRNIEEGSGANALVEKAKRFDIPNEDMLRASDRPTYLENGMLNPELPQSFTRLGSEGIEFHEELLNWWKFAGQSIDEAVGTKVLPGFVNDLYAARYLGAAGKKILGGEGVEIAAHNGLGGSPWKKRSYVTPGHYEKMVAQYGEERAADLFSQTWMGQQLENVTGPGATGKSIRDQMDEIGENVLGKREYQQLFSNDFEQVVIRYISDMERGVRMKSVLASLENAGAIIKSTPGGGVRMSLFERIEHIAENARQFDANLQAHRRAAQRVGELDNLSPDDLSPAVLGRNYAGEGDWVMLGMADDLNAVKRTVRNLQTGEGSWLPTRLQKAIKDLNAIKVPDDNLNWAAILEDYAEVANSVAFQVASLRKVAAGIGAAKESAGIRTAYGSLRNVNRDLLELESAIAQMNGLMARAAMNDKSVRAAQQMVRTLETGQIPSNMMPEMKAWAKKYKEWIDLDNLTGSTVYMHAADEAFLQAAVNQIGKGTDLPDLAYLANKVDEVRNVDVGPVARVYTEALEEATAAADQWAVVAPELQNGLNEARVLAQKDLLTSDELFNQQKYLQSAKEQITNLELEMNRARRSADLGKRISAVDNQEDAIRMLNDERTLRGFQHGYNEALSNELTGPWLTGYQAVNMSENADLFANAMYAAAKLNDPKAFAEWTKGYMSLLNFWKAQAVATPGFVIRNIMGATWINSQIAGVPMGSHSRIIAQRREASRASQAAVNDSEYLQHIKDTAARAGTVPVYPVRGDWRSGTSYVLWRMGKEGKGSIKIKGLRGLGREFSDTEWKHFKWIADSGIAEGGQAYSEVVQAVEQVQRKKSLAPWRSNFFLYRGVREQNERAEFMVRGALAMHVLQTGGSKSNAVNQVRKFHFDYSEITPTEAKIKAVIPFWKWQKNILPVLVESIGTNPKAWSRLQQIKGEVEYMSGEEGVVPDYFMENLGVRLPWRMDGSQVYLLPDMPFRDLNRWMKPGERDITGIKPLDMATRIAAEAAFPLAKLPLELWAGQLFFADIPLKGRYQQVPPSYRSVPGLMPILGALGKAEKNRQGEWKMTDSDLYILDQMFPIMGRLRRLIPGEEKYEKRWTTTFISTMLGGGLRVNTPEEQRNQLIRMQRDLDEHYRKMVDVEVRKV
tara:strand:+ start:4254 stop:8897 length:4644 start_codon:yes stop_codon:yes gene_type:complete